jgi:uncharacterized MAPEG superfamily protein
MQELVVATLACVVGSWIALWRPTDAAGKIVPVPGGWRFEKPWSYLALLLACYDLTGGTHFDPLLPTYRLTPLRALWASGLVTMLAVLASIWLDPAGASYPNAHPRTFQRTGHASQRAWAAHQNGLESFPVFAAGVLAALHAGVDASVASSLATTHVLARALYTIWYVSVCRSERLGGNIRSGLWWTASYAAWRLVVLAAEKLEQ